MKRLFTFFVFALIFGSAFTQNAVYEKALAEFEPNYNSDKFEEIFGTFSNEMKVNLPLAKTMELFTGLKAQVGNITKREFIQFQNGTFAAYKTTFEKAILSLNISVDKNGKIDGLSITPFQQKNTGTTTVINTLTNIPAEQKDILYRAIKDFPNKTQVSIAFIENGTPKYYGIIKENDTLKFIDNKNNVFEIGSITKVFTSALLANSVIERKIDLDDKINKYYNFHFKNNIEINFKDLANHTSGLDRLPSNLDLSKADPANPFSSYTGSNLESYLKNDLKLNGKAGEKYEYSNLGVGLLGYTLSILYRSSYTGLLKEKIFGKYQMTSSFTNRNSIENRLVKGLDSEGNETANWDFDVFSSAGGILSTVTDMAKFAIAQFDERNQELTLTRTPTFTVNESLKIGLGWHIVKVESVKDIYKHNGGTGGYSSSIVLNVERKNGVILLTNVSTFNPSMGNIDELCFVLWRILDKK